MASRTGYEASAIIDYEELVMKTEEQLRQERAESYQRGLNDGLERAARICGERGNGPAGYTAIDPKITAQAIRAQIKK